MRYSLIYFVYNNDSFADITHAGVFVLKVNYEKPALFLMSQKILQLICRRTRGSVELRSY